jgi:hypothetical protein
MGVVGPDREHHGAPGKLQTYLLAEPYWKGGPEGVTVPYAKGGRLPSVILSTTGHANPVGIRAVHCPRLNTSGDR